jgi:hypothetical protein
VVTAKPANGGQGKTEREEAGDSVFYPAASCTDANIDGCSYFVTKSILVFRRVKPQRKLAPFQPDDENHRLSPDVLRAETSLFQAIRKSGAAAPEYDIAATL